MGFGRIRNIYFVLGVVAAFFVTVSLMFFTSLMGISPYLTPFQKVVKGMQTVVVLMMAILVFTVPALILHARKLRQEMKL